MPRTQPASKTTMIAVAQAEAAHERVLREIANAAVEDNPVLKGASLDVRSGVWTLPEAPE